ncbi:angiotensinogen [Ambystoma mexicanum]|uniref:angiotensinogen n=1 Tax=Ambystoma mexicanum TaxID=8296 RepID=UPI0037E84AAB
MHSGVILVCLAGCITIAACNRVYVHPFHLFAYNQSSCEKLEQENQTTGEAKTFIPISIDSKITDEEEILRDRFSSGTQSLDLEGRQMLIYLTELVNILGFRLFAAWKEMHKSETVLLSPTNLFGTLVSFYLGASKDTSSSLQPFLGFPSGGPNCTFKLDGHIVFTSLKAIDSLLLSKGVNIDASKMAFLFVAPGVHLSESFVYDLLPSADSLFVRAVAFSDPAVATEQINSFFNDRISRKGNPVLTTVDAATTLMYASYMHFKGKVKNAFPLADHQDFWIDSNTKVLVPMMSVKGRFEFKHDDVENVLVIKVPLSENDFLLLVQPTHGNTLKKIESTLSFNSYSSFFGNLRSRSVHLTMPKLSIESTYDIQDILAHIQLPNLLGKKSDLSRMSDADIRVGKIVNKVYFELEDCGMDAGQRMDPSGEDVPLEVTLNKPYLLAVYEGGSKVLMALSSVRNPMMSV